MQRQIKYVEIGAITINEVEWLEYESKAKDELITLRLPASLLVLVKKIADKKQIPYTRLIRYLLEKYIWVEFGD